MVKREWREENLVLPEVEAARGEDEAKGENVSGLRERLGGRRRWMGERVAGGDDDKRKKKKKKKKRVFSFF
ncbi:hypothetical protein MTR_3g114675 [Medicago truncatula]|uniref:Uncharacterized protein n=1 Tax=Medicago truncatula TaxID=3880 RepID=A0A072VDM1_MEDTR|nr:hypothetical protein MTR_3g114675 [Medicago truncatula]